HSPSKAANLPEILQTLADFLVVNIAFHNDPSYRCIYSAGPLLVVRESQKHFNLTYMVLFVNMTPAYQ
ncbi:MAG: hypothetical protein KAI21_09040, partial [Deltaproteobacteria bacterium]|nr:hypothetical protein [Deltaproteobacteria bacterium]